jgi:hypothetical protein
MGEVKNLPDLFGFYMKGVKLWQQMIALKSSL